MVVDSDVPSEPSLKHLQSRTFGLPKDEQHKAVQDISKAHIDSFNFLLREGLGKAIMDIQPLEMELPNKDRLKVELKDATIGMPVVHKDSIHASTYKVYPAECRSRGVTYRGKLQVSISWSKNGAIQDVVEKVIGEVPVMVKSNACNLNKLKPKQLLKCGEEVEEFGGYFIINGNERIVRMLIMQRRNYPIAMARPSWKNRGSMFTEYGVSIRCVRSDQSGSNMVLHYLTNGSVEVMITYRMELFFIPLMLILKALCDVTDHFIFNELLKGKEDDIFYKGCITNMLRQLQSKSLFAHYDVKNYLGEKFRVKMNLPSWYTNSEVADFLLKKCVCVHLDSDTDKFNMLVFMTKKLFAVARCECSLESPDNPMNQEVLLPGHFCLLVIKEKLESWLFSVRNYIDKKVRTMGATLKVTKTLMNECFTHSMDLTRPVEYVFATGNFISRIGGSLMQTSGLTVVADKLNFWRYLSHFRCVHRGAFFAEMRTTTARKLLPEAWGFICPVHTPDGAPCGLLNHMTAMCEVINVQPPIGELHHILTCLGLMPCAAPLATPASECYTVVLDGKILGLVPRDLAPELVNSLRFLKVSGNSKVPETMEICFVPITGSPSLYPGIFLFTTPARMMRPVWNVNSETVEFIGMMEQVFLNVCITTSEAYEGVTTHKELRETSILSVLANMIPYSDFNQSPRNMYECQMGKQTMGTPCHSFKYRSDNKLYRIQTPQSPLVRPALYDYYQMDDYPLGTNAIVAVISYTGYDMEDAMVLNKSSLERGFKHGSVYKSEYINLRTKASQHGSQVSFVFGRKDTNGKISNFIDEDGLPYIGTRLECGDPICGYINLITGEMQCEKYKSPEPAYILDVKLLGNDAGNDILQKICITFWIPRNPIIGDKFASRHGQKGVCSVYLPMEDMPFTESGMTPDIIFNPHGFPSRMTIGMMIESMAGKSAALHGVCHDATPFKFSEQKTACEYFGKMLKAAGYNYQGTERMYSGINGEEIEADIFFGIVYYQRLRHMVSDKYQMRTTGSVDILTHQPIKGRKRGGGIRFGEMERDSFVSHGSSFLLQDRLFNCSDRSLAYICTNCESIVSTLFEKPPPDDLPTSMEVRREWICNVCGNGTNVELVNLPYVFRYLAAELSSGNISLKLSVK